MSTPRRCGVSKCLTIDRDAVALLQEMCESSKAQGKFLSELVRREKALREQREQLRYAQCTICGEVGK